MGLLIGTVQRNRLLKEKSTLSWQLMLITTAISTASQSANNLLQVGTDYESDSLIAKKLQERQYKLKLLEEKLEVRKKEIETRLEEINLLSNLKLFILLSKISRSVESFLNPQRILYLFSAIFP